MSTSNEENLLKMTLNYATSVNKDKLFEWSKIQVSWLRFEISTLYFVCRQGSVTFTEFKLEAISSFPSSRPTF